MFKRVRCLPLLRALGSVALLAGTWTGALADERPRWEPKRTRVFLVSLTRYQGGTVAPWGKQERLDGAFVDLFKQRGVPGDQIKFLSDEAATSRNVSAEFDRFLDASEPGELLIFYFSSHGGYDPERGRYWYSSFDGDLSYDWALDAIERHFHGARVLMLADCCYSGGINELVEKRKSRFAYACLSSTYSHNIGFSGWRFFDCVMRGFAGAPVVDLDGDRQVELGELARFAEKHMAFVAEGWPMFTTTNGFDPHLIIATTEGPKKDAHVGEYVETREKGQWAKAEITDVRPGGFRVHHTAQGSKDNVWVPADDVRPFRAAPFKAGDRVRVLSASNDRSEAATVLDAWESLSLCRFAGRSKAYDEWVGPSRLRLDTAAKWTGQWAGRWENDVGQQGDDTLSLAEDAQGNFTGMWTGNVPVAGPIPDGDTLHLRGQTGRRSYEITGTLDGETLTLKYLARRMDEKGTYTGSSALTREK